MRPLLVALGFCVVCAQKPHQPSSDHASGLRRHPRRLKKPKASQETYTAPSWYVENTTYLLVGSWGLWFFLILVMSAVLDGMFDFRGGVSALVALGASTHGVDSFWVNLPRCTTCIYLHYDLQHLLNNSLGLVLAIWFWTTGSQSKVETDWMLYWQLPMWWISSVVGALFSYFTILKRAVGRKVSLIPASHHRCVWRLLRLLDRLDVRCSDRW
ncbi:MAG: hypothetical protein KVP17_002663 [Porospora cf. gigantea B]|uniref:uncharacterized protein n=1 Tax=Porospora cf. gigantea B TaxID=2853592 RepID=UPI003571F7E4|nr:MAG: hypothetical protein KVP17_002663 [Porospora cf. gigantea B]